MSDELMVKLRKSGLTVSIMGIESGGNTTLEAMRKLHTREEAAAFLAKCRNAGMQVELNLIVGFPTETEEHFQETVSFCTRTRTTSTTWSAWRLSMSLIPIYGTGWTSSASFWANATCTTPGIRGTNTLEVRLDRLKRLLETINDLDIMSVRTDYEIEAENDPKANKLISRYMKYWRNRTDFMPGERATAFEKGCRMRYEVRRRVALDLFERLGVLPQVIRVRQKLLDMVAS